MSPASGSIDIVGGRWKKRAETTAVAHVYSATPGVTSSSISAASSAIELFDRFFTPEVWDLLVTETNRYAGLRPQTSGSRPWHDTTVQELKAFIGILILMGIVRLPRLELYWSQTFPEIETPGISKVMSLVRFEQLFRFFHLADNANRIPYGQPGYDKLYKVRKLLDILSCCFESEYTIHQECSIDEAMIPFKGRVGFKQYIKDKPTKWGIKVFVLADARNGYIKRFQVYTGRGLDSGNSSIGLCTRVVLELLAGFEDSGLNLYTDRFYTSPALYKHLYYCGINACGTCVSSRSEFPSKALKISNLNRGTFRTRCNGPLVATSWVDKKVIYFLTTLHPARCSSPQYVPHRLSDGTRPDFECPPLLEDYTAFMRGVDRADQLQSYYNIGRRSRKWWRRVFFYIVECCVQNAFVLDLTLQPADHARVGRQKRDMMKFRLELASQLIGGFSSRSRRGRPRSGEHSQLARLQPSHRHWPVHCTRKNNCSLCW